MVNHKNLIGAEAYLFSKDGDRSESEISDLYKEWRLSNKWGILGLAINPNTSLNLLKEMIDGDYVDLSFFASQNPIFETMTDKDRNSFFGRLKLNRSSYVRDYCDQSLLYEELTEKAINPKTDPAELLNLSKMQIYQSSYIEMWHEPDGVDATFEDIDSIDKDSHGIYEMYESDQNLIELGKFLNSPLYPELLWLVMSNSSAPIAKIKSLPNFKSLLPIDKYIFDDYFFSIRNLIPFRIKIALPYLLQEELDLDNFSNQMLGDYGIPRQVDLTETLRLAHSNTKDDERVKYLTSVEFKFDPTETDDVCTRLLTYLSAGLYLKDSKHLKELIHSSSMQSQICGKWNPNSSQEVQEIILNQESLTEDYPDLESIAQAFVSELDQSHDSEFLQYWQSLTGNSDNSLIEEAHSGNASSLATFTWLCLQEGRHSEAIDLYNHTRKKLKTKNVNDKPLEWELANCDSNQALNLLALGSPTKSARELWDRNLDAGHNECLFYSVLMQVRENKIDAKRISDLPQNVLKEIRAVILEGQSSQGWYQEWCKSILEEFEEQIYKTKKWYKFN